MDDFKRNVGDTVHNVEQGIGNAARNAEDAVEGVFSNDNVGQSAHESLADAVEGLRQDAGAQGRTLDEAEQQGVLEVGHDGEQATPGFFGDHRLIDDSGNDSGNPNQ